jgi:hypothetical protein
MERVFSASAAVLHSGDGDDDVQFWNKLHGLVL